MKTLKQVPRTKQKKLMPLIFAPLPILPLAMGLAISPILLTSASAQGETAGQAVDVQVIDTGFDPKTLHVKTDRPVTLNITRKSDLTCSTEIVIPQLKIKKTLPLNQTVAVGLGRLKKGDIKFGCGMNMMDHGVITAE